MNDKLLDNAACAYAALTCKTLTEYAEKHQYTDFLQAQQNYKKCKHCLSLFLEMGFTEQDILVGFMDGEIISLT